MKIKLSLVMDLHGLDFDSIIGSTRCRYILGVLTHTTAWKQHWGGDETLKKVLKYAAWLHLT